MTLQATSGRLEFHDITGELGETRGAAAFGSRIKVINTVEGGQRPRAWALVSGFNARFNGQDKPLHQLVVDLNVVQLDDALPNAIAIIGRLGLRDRSGNFDDSYGGWIDYVVIADIED